MYEVINCKWLVARHLVRFGDRYGHLVPEIACKGTKMVRACTCRVGGAYDFFAQVGDESTGRRFGMGPGMRSQRKRTKLFSGEILEKSGKVTGAVFIFFDTSIMAFKRSPVCTNNRVLGYDPFECKRVDDVFLHPGLESKWFK